MQDALRDTDIVARLGGDEFVILLDRPSSSNKVIKIAENLIQSLSMNYEIKGKSLSIGTSIGISLYPEHDTHAERLLKKADEALYKAKENRGQAILYGS